MVSIKACASVALAILVAASGALGESRPGIRKIRMEYTAFVSGELCPSAIASFELSFPDGSDVPQESNSSLALALTPSDNLHGPGCSEKGLICAQPAAVSEDDRSVTVTVTLDASALPDGVFGEYIELKASLIFLDLDHARCRLPDASTARIYTNCIDPPAPGDVFRRGGGGLFEILDVSPPACGFVPIPTVPQTWGGIKAIYR